MKPLIGWPFDEPPLTYGYEDGIAWATRAGRYDASINGYAQIPAEHPLAHVADYNQIDADVHGGVTFGPEGGRSIESIGGWIGFDTVHWRDWWSVDELRAAGLNPDPEHLALMAELYGLNTDRLLGQRPSLTLAYVEKEARGLAAQIAAAGEWDRIDGLVEWEEKGKRGDGKQ